MLRLTKVTIAIISGLRSVTISDCKATKMSWTLLPATDAKNGALSTPIMRALNEF